jgi:molybdate transport system substrate-binding protein
MRRAFLIGLLLVLSACTAQPAERSLTVAAAASLAPVFDALQSDFEQQTGIRLTFAYGATGSLAEQIRNGGPFDVFASADAQRVDQLIEEFLLDGETRTVFAHGRLVLVASPISSYAVDSLAALAEPAVTSVALANPNHAPYGAAAMQALVRSDLHSMVESKLISAESVRQAGQMVFSGNASTGIIAASTAQSMDLPIITIAPELYEPIEHVLAIHTSSPNADLAGEFIAFLTGPAGQQTLHDFGLNAVDR